MALYNFDDSNIWWYTLDGFDYLYYHIYAIDEPNKIIDVLFKFTVNEQIVLHRHKALNTTFVVQGEHRLYRANGEIKDVRAVGSYTISPPDNEPHREGGGVTARMSSFCSAYGVAMACYMKSWTMTKTKLPHSVFKTLLIYIKPKHSSN